MSFTKIGGGWVFQTEHSTWMAERNIAGFAHRNWDLWQLVPDTTAHDGTRWKMAADQLPTRKACHEVAEAAERVTALPYRCTHVDPCPNAAVCEVRTW